MDLHTAYLCFFTLPSLCPKIRSAPLSRRHVTSLDQAKSSFYGHHDEPSVLNNLFGKMILALSSLSWNNHREFNLLRFIVTSPVFSAQPTSQAIWEEGDTLSSQMKKENISSNSSNISSNISSWLAGSWNSHVLLLRSRNSVLETWVYRSIHKSCAILSWTFNIFWEVALVYWKIKKISSWETLELRGIISLFN